jgi:hypothetical protein
MLVEVPMSAHEPSIGLHETDLSRVGTSKSRRLFKKALSHPPTPRAPRRTPFPNQGRSFTADPRFTVYASRFTSPGSDARTPPGKRRVSARRGWVGEMVGFFNSLLVRASAVDDEGHRPVVQQFDLHVRSKNSGFQVNTVIS